jgi:hypothetical protein
VVLTRIASGRASRAYSFPKSRKYSGKAVAVQEGMDRLGPILAERATLVFARGIEAEIRAAPIYHAARIEAESPTAA